MHIMFGINTKSLPAATRARNLLLMRCIAIVAQLAVIGEAYFGLALHLNYRALLTIVGVEIVTNFAFWLHTKHITQDCELGCFTQLFTDTCFLAILLYFSGGASNPFVSLFLVPVAIAAAVLGRVYAWSLTITTIVLYSLLMKYNIPYLQY